MGELQLDREENIKKDKENIDIYINKYLLSPYISKQEEGKQNKSAFIAYFEVKVKNFLTNGSV